MSEHLVPTFNIKLIVVSILSTVIVPSIFQVTLSPDNNVIVCPLIIEILLIDTIVQVAEMFGVMITTTGAGVVGPLFIIVGE